MSKNSWTLALVVVAGLFLLFVATKRNVDQQAVVTETPATVEEPAQAPTDQNRDTNTIIRDGLGAPRFN